MGQNLNLVLKRVYFPSQCLGLDSSIIVDFVGGQELFLELFKSLWVVALLDLELEFEAAIRVHKSMRLQIFDRVELLDHDLSVLAILPIVHSLDFDLLIVTVRVKHLDLVASFVARIQIEEFRFKPMHSD